MAEYAIYDASLGKLLDAFYIALLDKAEMTLLPDLYEVFGRESTVRFLELFAGTTIRIPNKDIIYEAVINASIYARCTKKFSKETIRDLCQIYKITPKKVLQIYRRMRHLARSSNAEPLKSKEPEKEVRTKEASKVREARQRMRRTSS